MDVNECGVGDVPQPSTVVGVTGECTFQTVSREKSTNTTIVSYIRDDHATPCDLQGSQD